MIWFNLACALCALLGLALLRRTRSRFRTCGLSRHTLLTGSSGLLLLGFSLLPLVWLVASIRGDSSPRSEQLTANIAYDRESTERAVIHWATVDLASLGSCLEFNATQPDGEGLVDASTGTEYGARTGSDLAVNVAFYYPIREYPHWSSYPTSGDPITAIGHVVVSGRRYGIESEWRQYLMLDANAGTAVIGSLPDGDLPISLHALPGREMILEAGTIVLEPDTGTDRYPRTVVGIDQDAGSLVLAVVDGKQFGYSSGLSLGAVGRLMLERGVEDAIEFDGGGSATMVGRVDGTLELLSRPSHTRIPGRERPVATFFGLIDNC